MATGNDKKEELRADLQEFNGRSGQLIPYRLGRRVVLLFPGSSVEVTRGPLTPIRAVLPAAIFAQIKALWA